MRGGAAHQTRRGRRARWCFGVARVEIQFWLGRTMIANFILDPFPRVARPVRSVMDYPRRVHYQPRSRVLSFVSTKTRRESRRRPESRIFGANLAVAIVYFSISVCRDENLFWHLDHTVTG